jgi:hypothetical protein
VSDIDIDESIEGVAGGITAIGRRTLPPVRRHGVTDGSASRGVNDPGGGRKAWPDRPIVWVVHTTACVSLKEGRGGDLIGD